MEFNLNHYINLIRERNFDGAYAHKNESIPNRLFKYFSLSENALCEDIKLDNKKLKSIEYNQIWLSPYSDFNDPFEMKALYHNNEHPYGNPKKVIGALQNKYVISCLSTNLKECMPMWAHYSNNHNGFCVEYEVIKTKFIYPVVYTNSRIKTNMYAGYGLAKRILNQNESYILENYNEIFRLGFCIKHKSWEYENEYRLLFQITGEGQGGFLENTESLGIKIKAIYIGINCRKNKIKLRNIARKLNIDIYQMKLNEDTSSYSLDFDRVTY